MMKRCITVILTIILCFTLAACGMDYEEKGYADAKEIIAGKTTIEGLTVGTKYQLTEERLKEIQEA